jgi:hypothetical protein
MKNKTKLFVLAMSVILLFSSCMLFFPSTYKFNLDQQNPAAQNATIIFENDTSRGYFIFKEWNGTDITNTIYKKKFITSNDTIKITVPAGMNTFLFNLKYTFGDRYSSSTYSFDNTELQYFLDAGKTYKMKGKYKRLELGFKGTEFYVQIYDITKKTTLLKEWMVGKKD